MKLDQDALDKAAELLVSRRPVVFLTGAGVSVESGIPDFRSPGGLWERFDPMEYAEIHTFLANPRKVWRMLRELEKTLDAASPNAGHLALARLEQLGVVSAVVTQNIDNLHQEAGSRRVIEFHGNGRRLVCVHCGLRFDAERLRDQEGSGDEPPTCQRCGEILKPEVVFFGEAIPEKALVDSFELAQTCGAMVIAGTSATVMPCSALPGRARNVGAALIEINLERSGITSMVDVALRGPWATVMPALTAAVEARMAVV
jgi:NAD-dependent deacetylase